MAQALKRITLWVSPEDHDQVKHLAEERGVSLSQLLRDGLRTIRHPAIREAGVAYTATTAEEASPVRVQEGKVAFWPERMEPGRFYLAQVDDKAYLYRRVEGSEVEVYAMAE